MSTLTISDFFGGARVQRTLSRALRLALLAALGCSPAPGPSPGAASPSSPSPTALGASAGSSPELALPDLERARIQYALESVALLEQEWPWLQPGQTCVLLVSQNVQWIVNCGHAPSEFDDLHAPLLDRPVYARRADTLVLNHKQIPVVDFLQALPATVDLALPGEEAGLGGSEPWILVSSLDALTGAHPGFKAAPSEKWVSVFVHEFFHTRQLSRPDLLPTLQVIKGAGLDTETLEQSFLQDLDYRALVKHERDILSSAAARNDALTQAAAIQALAEWSAAYEQRRAQLQRLGGDTLVQTDLVLTYLEGTARYVEALFLHDARFHPAEPLQGDPRFASYRPYATAGYQGLPQTGLDPSYFYCIGLHLALLLDRAVPDWKSRVIEQPDWIIGLARSAAQKP